MSSYTPKDITVDDVHVCVDCDDQKDFNADHSLETDPDKVKVLAAKGVDSDVAVDMLQHYQGSDGDGEFTAEDAYTEYFEHSKFHKSGKAH